MSARDEDLAAEAADEQRFTETNDPEVTRFDVGAGGVAESHDDTELAVDGEAAAVPTDSPDGTGDSGSGLGSDSGSGSGGGPIEGVPEGEPESTEERRDGADERTDPAAPPAQEPPG